VDPELREMLQSEREMQRVVRGVTQVKLYTHLEKFLPQNQDPELTGQLMDRYFQWLQQRQEQWAKKSEDWRAAEAEARDRRQAYLREQAALFRRLEAQPHHPNPIRR
jgi:predicted exporter